MSESPEIKIWRNARLLSLSGTGVTDFLQGYLTCDTARIQADHLTPTALCNVKGRVVTSGWVFALKDGDVALLVHATLADKVSKFLTPYAMFSKCKITPLPLAVVTAGDSPPANTQVSFAATDWLPPLHICALAGPTALSLDSCDNNMDEALIRARFAFVEEAISETYLPQMLGLDEVGAVDFDKGCYLGQEIVARATYRGAVKRKLVEFSWQARQPVIGQGYPARPEPVQAVVSICHSGASGTPSGLGLGISTKPPA